MAGAVYHIWRARNECIFGNKQPFPEGVSDQIMKDVRDSLYLEESRDSHGNRALCIAWNISDKIL